MASVLGPVIGSVLAAVQVSHKAARPAGIRYDTSARDLFQRFNREPSALRKRLVNDLIVAGKDHGWFFVMDGFGSLAMGLDDPGYTTPDDAHAALRNWVADIYNPTMVGLPTLVTDQGGQGNGTTTCFDIGFNPVTAVGAKFTKDSAHAGAVSRTDGAIAGYDMGNTNFRFSMRNTNGDTLRLVANDTGFRNVGALATGLGHWVVNRTDPAASQAHRNGVAIAPPGTNPTTAMSNDNFRLCGAPGSFSPRQLSVWHLGGELADAHIPHLHTDVSTFLQAIGAA